MKMYPKLLILTNTSGGLYLFRQDLIKALQLMFEIYVITTDTGRLEELKKLGCNVKVISMDRRGTNPIRDLKLFMLYLFTMKKLKPSYVLTYTVKPNIYGCFAAKILRIPYAANITGLGTGFQSKKLRRVLIFMYKRALRKASVVFCENSSIKDEIVADHIVEDNKVHVLHGAGVNLDYFSYQPYPSDSDEFIFLFIGRVMPEKGINELLQATKRLYDEDNRCRLTIVGSISEGFELNTKDYKWVNYKGQQKDVRPYIASSHCFVLPSYHEGMANTNLECASSGRPIITSNIPGCREAVINNVSGFLCSPKDPENLYLVLKRMMYTSNEERINMGIAGREHMKLWFDKQAVVNDTVKRIISDEK